MQSSEVLTELCVYGGNPDSGLCPYNTVVLWFHGIMMSTLDSKSKDLTLLLSFSKAFSATSYVS
jgi:hypothetical protein